MHTYSLLSHTFFTLLGSMIHARATDAGWYNYRYLYYCLCAAQLGAHWEKSSNMWT